MHDNTEIAAWYNICSFTFFLHYSDVIMGKMASQITSLTIVSQI